MRKWLKSIQFISYLLIMGLVSFHGFAYASGGPQPPPVDIEITTGGIPRVGEEIEIKIKVTPQEDMHADISCLLPNGIDLIREKGIMLLPYQDRYGYNRQREMNYRYAAGLHVGPLKAGITKELTFHITARNIGHYELICVVEALAKWGSKEERLIIELN